MGFTYVGVNLYNPADSKKTAKVNLLLDSKALFSSVLGELLQKMELRPVERRKLKVYGGMTVERDISSAVIEYQGHRATVPVIFAEPQDTSVLGATALESLGYELDPVTKKLRAVELLML
jgi:aspartyl protease family protein